MTCTCQTHCYLDGYVLAALIISALALLITTRRTPFPIALESLPLLAGSTTGLLLLASSSPLVPPQHNALVILAVGALAMIPLLISKSPKAKKSPKTPIPKLSLTTEPSSSATHPTPTGTTTTSALSYQMTPSSTAPGTPADTETHHHTQDQGIYNFAEDYLHTTLPTPAVPTNTPDLQGDTLALEDEFVRLLLRSAARANNPKMSSFGGWNEEWPVYWEGAGLASKGCW